MPYANIDSRIKDLALGFFQNPDVNLGTGYKRLEDIVGRMLVRENELVESRSLQEPLRLIGIRGRIRNFQRMS